MCLSLDHTCDTKKDWKHPSQCSVHCIQGLLSHAMIGHLLFSNSLFLFMQLFYLTAEETNTDLFDRAIGRPYKPGTTVGPDSTLPPVEPDLSIKMQPQQSHEKSLILFRLLLLGCYFLPTHAYLPDVNIFTNYRTEVYNGQQPRS